MEEKIKEIINEWDPIGLMTLVPSDEYKEEASEIFCFYQNCSDVRTLADRIKEIFTDQFGNFFDKTYEECFDIASKILNHNK